MAIWTKYHCYGRDKRAGVHVLDGTTHQLMVALSNTAPNVATHEVLADVSELATANGYTAGGIDLQNTGVITSGVLNVDIVLPIVWTASGAGIAARYFILYNATPTTPLKPLIAFLDRGVGTTVPAGQTLALNGPTTNFLQDS